MRINAKGIHYRALNEWIRKALAVDIREIVLEQVNGQRYIGDGLSGDVRITVNGTPGNDLGAFMDGPTIEVFGNAQDALGNTMNAGKILIHGHAGDIIGYAMRGGKIFIRGDVGYRVGIHMKAYKDLHPVIIVGGVAQDFLGEYMAGGSIILLGLDADPQKPTSFAPPVSVTITCPGFSRSCTPMCLTSLNQMPCASTISSVVSSFHIGRLGGTQRIVSAAPQNFIPSHNGRTSGHISVRSKYPIPSSASHTSTTRRYLYSFRTSNGSVLPFAELIVPCLLTQRFLHASIPRRTRSPPRSPHAHRFPLRAAPCTPPRAHQVN